MSTAISLPTVNKTTYWVIKQNTEGVSKLVRYSQEEFERKPSETKTEQQETPERKSENRLKECEECGKKFIHLRLHQQKIHGRPKKIYKKRTNDRGKHNYARQNTYHYEKRQ